LLGCIFSTKAHIANRKKWLNSNISSTRPHNMANVCPLAAEIGPIVWGTPANVNGFRVLAALLHGTPVVGVSQTFAALNRGRHLYSAGRSSRWALAHILVSFSFSICSLVFKLHEFTVTPSPNCGAKIWIFAPQNVGDTNRAPLICVCKITPHVRLRPIKVPTR